MLERQIIMENDREKEIEKDRGRETASMRAIERGEGERSL